jgi:hypothetical protein
MTEQLHILDGDLETDTDSTTTADTNPSPEVGGLEERAANFYETATDPPWEDIDRQTAAFMKSLLPAVEKDEYLDDRRRIHHYKQLDDIRLVDELNPDETDDVDLGLLFALPDESLLFVGSDPTAKDTRPLFGFVVEPFAPFPAPTSAQDALDLLRPGAVREAFARDGDEPDRQGEWWLLPTDKVPTSLVYKPGVDSRPYGPSPLGNHVPREYGFTTREPDFLDAVRERVPALPDSVQSAPEVMEWVHRQHQKRPTPEYAPEWDTIQDAAGEILVRGTLRHRENDHFVENAGDDWHSAQTHDMNVYTADEFDRVVLD